MRNAVSTVLMALVGLSLIACGGDNDGRSIVVPSGASIQSGRQGRTQFFMITIPGEGLYRATDPDVVSALQGAGGALRDRRKRVTIQVVDTDGDERIAGVITGVTVTDKAGAVSVADAGGAFRAQAIDVGSIRVVLESAGDTGKGVIGFGKVAIDRAIVRSGAKLDPNMAAWGDSIFKTVVNKGMQTEEGERSHRVPVAQPENGFRVNLDFRPGGKVKTIQELAGKITLRKGNIETIELEDLPGARSESKQRELKDAKLSVSVRPEGAVRLVFRGATEKLISVSMADEDTDRSHEASRTRRRIGRPHEYVWTAWNEIPDANGKLKIRLSDHMQTVELPFDFSALEIPAQPSEIQSDVSGNTLTATGPSGETITATMRWHAYGRIWLLHLDLVVTGGAVANTLQYGLDISTWRDGADKDVTFDERRFRNAPDMFPDPISAKLSPHRDWDPDSGIRMSLPITTQVYNGEKWEAVAIDPTSRLKGMVLLSVPKAPDAGIEVAFDATLRDQELESSLLADAGLTGSISVGRTMKLRVSLADRPAGALADAKLVKEDGEPIGREDGRMRSTAEDGGVLQTQAIDLICDQTRGVKLVVSLIKEFEDQEVPFLFKDIPVQR